MVYNDQPPPDGSAPSSYGHSKGVFMVDDQVVGNASTNAASSPINTATAGFWLLHSTPRFPLTDGPVYTGLPENEHVYGQSYLCISQGVDSLVAASQLLYMNHPYVFNSSLSPAVAQKLPLLPKVESGDHSTSSDCKQVAITGASGTKFVGFGKATEFAKDLWGECVAPGIGSDLLVESWLRGYEEGGYCTP